MASKFTVKIGGPAGRIGAQTPGTNAANRKLAILARDLEQTKQDLARPHAAVFFQQSPYSVQANERFLWVNAADGVVQILLPSAFDNRGREIIIHKRDGSGNAVQVTGASIGLGTSTVSSIYLHDQGASVTLLAPDIHDAGGSYVAIATIGTVDITP